MQQLQASEVAVGGAAAGGAVAARSLAMPSLAEQLGIAVLPNASAGSAGRGRTNTKHSQLYCWLVPGGACSAATYACLPQSVNIELPPEQWNPVASSWSERTLDKKVYDQEDWVKSCGIVSRKWPYNFELVWDGIKIVNNKGYAVRMYTVRAIKPVPWEAALELGRNIQAKVNADPSNNTTLHLDPQRFIISQEAKYNDFLGQEKADELMKHLLGAPSSHPDGPRKWFSEHEESGSIHAFLRKGQLDLASARVLGAPIEWVHPDDQDNGGGLDPNSSTLRTRSRKDQEQEEGEIDLEAESLGSDEEDRAAEEDAMDEEEKDFIVEDVEDDEDEEYEE